MPTGRLSTVGKGGSGYVDSASESLSVIVCASFSVLDRIWMCSHVSPTVFDVDYITGYLIAEMVVGSVDGS